MNLGVFVLLLVSSMTIPFALLAVAHELRCIRREMQDSARYRRLKK